MPRLERTYTIDVTPENFLNNCSREELIELELLLSKPRYQELMYPQDDDSLLKNNFTPIQSVNNSFFDDKELNHIRQWFNTTIDQNQDKDIKKTEWELGLKIHTKLNIKPENRIVKNCG